MVLTHFEHTSGLVGCALGCHVGGRELNSSQTSTQGLKITEEKVLPLYNYTSKGLDFQVSDKDCKWEVLSHCPCWKPVIISMGR